MSYDKASREHREEIQMNNRGTLVIKHIDHGEIETSIRDMMKTAREVIDKAE